MTIICYGYDFLIGRAIDSIKGNDERKVFTPDYFRWGLFRSLLMYPLITSGILIFWCFNRRRKIWLFAIAFIASDLVLMNVPYFWSLF
jgi:hypothetical protein